MNCYVPPSAIWDRCRWQLRSEIAVVSNSMAAAAKNCRAAVTNVCRRFRKDAYKPISRNVANNNASKDASPRLEGLRGIGIGWACSNVQCNQGHQTMLLVPLAIQGGSKQRREDRLVLSSSYHCTWGYAQFNAQIQGAKHLWQFEAPKRQNETSTNNDTSRTKPPRFHPVVDRVTSRGSQQPT